MIAIELCDRGGDNRWTLLEGLLFDDRLTRSRSDW